MILLSFLLLLHHTEVEAEAVAAAQDFCKVTTCNPLGPPVRFPFWLKHHQPDHCGYPDSGFELTCNPNNQAVLHLPQAVQLLVEDIEYEAQRIRVSDSNGCLGTKLPSLNLSASPFQFETVVFRLMKPPMINITLFKCSRNSSSEDHPSEDYSFPFIEKTCPITAIPSDEKDSYNLLNCSKIVDIPAAPREIIYGDYVYLKWSKPMCSACETQGKHCRILKKNSSSAQDQTQCYDIPKLSRRKGIPTKLKAIIAGVILASFLLVLIAIGLYYVYRLEKRKKESQLKIEKFLEDYRSFTPSRYSYADIKKITNQFKDKLGQGGYGTVFKGRLSNDVLVAVKVLNDFKGNGEEFINEVGSMTRIHHVNVARLVGFCADGYKRALVYEYLPNESLEKFIFATRGENPVLGWNKLQDIALGIAKGIEYLHQGCEQRILHFDIKPHNILLDQNFNPKISDFGLAKLCSKEQSAVSVTAARGTMGYIAPEVFSRNFGNVSYKSDIYSFGMLLLEMVGGRKNIDVTAENTSQVYFPEWAYNILDKGEELRLRIEDEMHSEIARKLTIVGLWCIQWHPVDRPSMKAVIQMLESKADNLTRPPNPFASSDHMKMSAYKYKKPVDIELAVIAE